MEKTKSQRLKRLAKGHRAQKRKPAFELFRSLAFWYLLGPSSRREEGMGCRLPVGEGQALGAGPSPYALPISYLWLPKLF